MASKQSFHMVLWSAKSWQRSQQHLHITKLKLVVTTCWTLHRFAIGSEINASVTKGTRENLKRRPTCMLQGLLWRQPQQQLLVWEDFNKKNCITKLYLFDSNESNLGVSKRFHYPFATFCSFHSLVFCVEYKILKLCTKIAKNDLFSLLFVRILD